MYEAPAGYYLTFFVMMADWYTTYSWLLLTFGHDPFASVNADERFLLPLEDPFEHVLLSSEKHAAYLVLANCFKSTLGTKADF